MRILITGAAGFIGSHTTALLLSEGHEVRALDNLDPQVHGKGASQPELLQPHFGDERFAFVKGDVRNRGLMVEALEGVDAVLHLAAAVGVGQSMYRPAHYLDVNAHGTGELFDLLINGPNQVKKLVVASSNTIYGEGAGRGADGQIVAPSPREPQRLSAGDYEIYDDAGNPLEPVPTPESKALDCTTVYAISKRIQEEVTMVLGRAYGIAPVGLRYFNVYGPGQSLSNPYTGVAAIFTARWKSGHRPVIFEDGLQTRDFVHVSDVARANWLALTRDEADGQVFNVGTGTATSVLDLAKGVSRILDKEHLPPEIPGNYRPGDIRHCFADISKIQERLGFTPEVSFEQGLEELVEWAAAQDFEDRGQDALEELKERGLVR